MLHASHPGNAKRIRWFRWSGFVPESDPIPDHLEENAGGRYVSVICVTGPVPALNAVVRRTGHGRRRPQRPGGRRALWPVRPEQR